LELLILSDLQSIIVKTGDSMSQEQFAMQLLQQLENIFVETDLPALKLRTYKVVATSADAGLIEVISDAGMNHSFRQAENCALIHCCWFALVSLHGMKELLASQGTSTTLGAYFGQLFKPEGSQPYKVKWCSYWLCLTKFYRRRSSSLWSRSRLIRLRLTCFRSRTGVAHRRIFC
jgi:phosphatidylinositol kinase/protein kinase (PI-3  family)